MRKIILVAGLALFISGGLLIVFTAFACPVILTGSGNLGNICAPFSWAVWVSLILGLSLMIVGFLLMLRASSTNDLSKKAPLSDPTFYG